MCVCVCEQHFRKCAQNGYMPTEHESMWFIVQKAEDKESCFAPKFLPTAEKKMPKYVRIFAHSLQIHLLPKNLHCTAKIFELVPEKFALRQHQHLSLLNEKSLRMHQWQKKKTCWRTKGCLWKKSQKRWIFWFTVQIFLILMQAKKMVSMQTFWDRVHTISIGSAKLSGVKCKKDRRVV